MTNSLRPLVAENLNGRSGRVVNWYSGRFQGAAVVRLAAFHLTMCCMLYPNPNGYSCYGRFLVDHDPAEYTNCR